MLIFEEQIQAAKVFVVQITFLIVFVVPVVVDL